MEYWEECIAEAFEDAKIVATEEQIKTVAFWVEGAHDNHGLATGRDCIPNPLDTEIDRLTKRVSELQCAQNDVAGLEECLEIQRDRTSSWKREAERLREVIEDYNR